MVKTNSWNTDRYPRSLDYKNITHYYDSVLVKSQGIHIFTIIFMLSVSQSSLQIRNTFFGIFLNYLRLPQPSEKLLLQAVEKSVSCSV